MILVETVRVEGGRPLLLERHLERLAASAAALGLPAPPPADWRESLAGRDGLLRGAWDGQTLSFCWRPLPPPGPRRLLPLRWDPPRTAAHKLAARERYDAAREQARQAGCDDALFVDAEGWLLETSTANVFVRAGGRLVTPPLDGRILPGVWRAELIERCGAVERAVSLDEALAGEVLLTGAGVRLAAGQVTGATASQGV